MKTFLMVVVAVATLFVAGSNNASAQQRVIIPGGDVRLTGGGGGIPGGGAWVGGSTLCTAGTLIVAAIVVGDTQGRELSREEAATALVTCFIPPAWLIACNSAWRTNASLPVATADRRRHRPDPRHRDNVFCAGLPTLAADPVVIRAAY